MAHMPARLHNETGHALYYRYLPPHIPMSVIRGFARRIAEKFDPEKVILFGSFAYGTPHEWSDVDLLLIMPAREELTKAAKIQLAFEPVFPLDILVRTPQRLRRRLADGDPFLKEVMSKGIVLYEKRNPHVGPKSFASRPGGVQDRGRRPCQIPGRATRRPPCQAGEFSGPVMRRV
jgi:predicted nucleotidyltransferase